MASRYRSAFPAALLSLAGVASGCSPLEPEVETLAIRAHSLDSSERCKVVANPNLQIQALGPFPVSPRSAEVLPFRTPEHTLTFPDDTQGVEATATDFDSTWLGYTDRRANREIDVLLWKERVGCELYDPMLEADPEAPTYPVSNGGQAIAYSQEAGIVLVSGGDTSSAAAQSSLIFHAGDGRSELIPSGFPQARAYATVTPFGSGLLLAGGEDPLVTDFVPDRIARETAVVYDPVAGGFEGETIELELARTRHAAVVLESGETLLVGGGRHSGGGTTLPVELLEAVSPSTRRTRLGAELAGARLEPVALRLSDGRVLVGGGYDIEHNPVTTLEWFSPDGATDITPPCTPPRPCELEARHHRALVAMPGGGALTVGGCEPGPSPQPADCIDACGENFGCPAAEFDANWIAPDGALSEVSLEQPLSLCPGVTQATPFSPEHVWLAPGSDGAPWLVAFDENLAPPCRAVFRLEPWEDAPVCGVTGAQCVVFAPVEFDLEGNFPDPKTTVTSLGPDVFVWLTNGDPPRLAGVRAGVRGALSQNEVLLGTAPSTPLVPLHLGPDRHPQGEAPRAPRALYRSGRLILEPENEIGPDVVVTLTDARYDDVTLSIGFSGSGPPVLRLDSYEVGGADCAWPSDPVTPLTVTRRAGTIETSDGSGRIASCKNAPARAVTLGFRARGTSTTLTSLEVKRD